MVSIFREKSSVSVFWLIALSIVIHSQFIIVPPQVLLNGNNDWLATFLAPLATLPSVAIVLLYHIIIIVQALRLSVVVNHLRLFPKVYFIPALCYLILTALCPAWNNLTPALVVNFFVIWLFSMYARLYSNQPNNSLIYNIGLLTGFIALVHNTALYLVITSFFAMALLRTFRLNEWMIMLLGILTPAYLLAAVLYLNDSLPLFLHHLPHFYWHLPGGANKMPLIIGCAAATVFIISGIISWQANIGKLVIQTRHSWSVLFVMFLISIPLVFGLRESNETTILLGMIPAAALASNTFVYGKNNLLQSILFWLMIIVVIFNNWFWLKT